MKYRKKPVTIEAFKGVQGEIYPCKPDIFEQTYEPVGEEE